MNTFIHFSVWFLICCCASLLVQVDTASGSQPQRNSSKDSLKVQTESTNTGTYKLLPKFNARKDTAGFKLIPKHYGDTDSNDADFEPYDKEPQIVKKVNPIYPEGAKREGLEGRVIVKMWVGKDGKVKQVVVLKSDAEVFNAPAIEAAKQFLFTPAYLNNKPVAVWVSYPFQFKLVEKKP